MKVIAWKHGEAWAVKTVDGKRRMHGFESREQAKQYASDNW